MLMLPALGGPNGKNKAILERFPTKRQKRAIELTEDGTLYIRKC
jgi:hypothetical protein